MAMSAARWHTTSMSVSSERTDPASRTSPATTSIWSRTSSSTVSSQPHEPNELYWTSARTR